MNGPNTSQVKPSLDIKSTTEVKCESCGCNSFIEAMLLRRVSALLTDTGKEGFLPIQVFACSACGHVNNGFIPAEIRPVASKIVTQKNSEKVVDISEKSSIVIDVMNTNI